MFRTPMMGLLLCLPALGFAATPETGEVEKKRFTASIVSYASVIGNDISGVGDDDLSGFGLSLLGVFTDNDSVQVAGRMTYAKLEHDDFSSIDSDVLEISVLAGQRLDRNGFKWYVGGGFFTDSWSFPGGSERFSGLQLTGGLGYNWSVVALDFWISIRDASDYESFIEAGFGSNVDASAVGGGLALGLRF
jgi:hypothetical protein